MTLIYDKNNSAEVLPNGLDELIGLAGTVAQEIEVRGFPRTIQVVSPPGFNQESNALIVKSTVKNMFPDIEVEIRTIETDGGVTQGNNEIQSQRVLTLALQGYPIELDNSQVFHLKPYTIEYIEEILSERGDGIELAGWIYKSTLGHPESVDNLISLVLAEREGVEKARLDEIWLEILTNMFKQKEYFDDIFYPGDRNLRSISLFFTVTPTLVYLESQFTFDWSYILNVLSKKGIVISEWDSVLGHSVTVNRHFQQLASEYLRLKALHVTK